MGVTWSTEVRATTRSRAVPDNDLIFGGAGTDTARYGDVHGNYYLVNWNGKTAVIPEYGVGSSAPADGIDLLVGVENVAFSNGTYSLASATNEYFRPLDYVASSSQLSNFFGASSNPEAIFNHYVFTRGHYDGFRTTFNGLDYIASNPDLMNYFGANASHDAGAAHYIQNGRFEGRTTTL